MPRTQGVFDFSANFEVKIVGPLDARTTVATKVELSDTLMQSSYPYAGMIATVTNDGVNNGLYLLKQMPCIDGNWAKIGEGSGFVSATYNNGVITLTKADGSTTTLNIGALVTGITVTNLEMVGTEVVLTRGDGITFTADVNELLLSGAQFASGVTTHDTRYITDASFVTSNLQTLFGGSAANESCKQYTITFANSRAKETTCIVTIASGTSQHYLLLLPNVYEASASANAGRKIIVYVKRNTISSTSKRFMVATKWNAGGTNNRIVSVSTGTEVTSVGHFQPLETYEMMEFFWDGSDWVALARNQEVYVSRDVQNYQSSVSEYIINRS